MFNMAKKEDKTVRNPILNCNGCRKDFKLKKKYIKKEWVTTGIERSYFTCPHCNKKYIICYEDNEFRVNIAKMDNLQKEASALDVNSEQAKELIKEYQIYHKRNIEISQHYRTLYDK